MLFWLFRVNEHSSYAGGLLGAMLVTAVGISLMFVPMSLVSLAKVALTVISRGPRAPGHGTLPAGRATATSGAPSGLVQYPQRSRAA